MFKDGFCGGDVQGESQKEGKELLCSQRSLARRRHATRESGFLDHCLSTGSKTFKSGRKPGRNILVQRQSNQAVSSPLSRRRQGVVWPTGSCSLAGSSKPAKHTPGSSLAHPLPLRLISDLGSVPGQQPIHQRILGSHPQFLYTRHFSLVFGFAH